MCPPCCSRTTLCSGVSLPYSPGSPSQSSPTFYGTMKTLRPPARRNTGLACLDRRFPPQTIFSLAAPVVPELRLDVVLPVHPSGSIRRPRTGSPVFPLNPLRVCHVLRPRRNFHAKPFQRFSVARPYRNGAGFRNAVISGFVSMASPLAVYASCRRHRRLRNTRFRLVAILGRFTRSGDRVHSVNFVVFRHLLQLRTFHGAMRCDPNAPDVNVCNAPPANSVAFMVTSHRRRTATCNSRSKPHRPWARLIPLSFLWSGPQFA